MTYLKYFTVAELIQVAEDAKKEVAAGHMKPDSKVHISLEVCDENNEDTFHHRVHGGESIQVGIGKQLNEDSYVHIQLIGQPNFNVYPQGE